MLGYAQSVSRLKTLLRKQEGKMKMRRGLFGMLLTALLLATVFAGTALAYDVSGTVNYSGSKTGRVFISVPNTMVGTLGTSVVLSGPGSVSFTIRGVPPSGCDTCSYNIKAFLDVQGTAIQLASEPTGSTNISV